jgi:hypothetical protein
MNLGQVYLGCDYHMRAEAYFAAVAECPSRAQDGPNVFHDDCGVNGTFLRRFNFFKNLGREPY